MVVLGICVLLFPSTEQLPNKRVSNKAISVTSNNLQSMFFYGAQKDMPFIIYTWDNGERNEKSIRH